MFNNVRTNLPRMWQRSQLNNRIDTMLEHSSVIRTPDIANLHNEIRCINETKQVTPKMPTLSPDESDRTSPTK